MCYGKMLAIFHRRGDTMGGVLNISDFLSWKGVQDFLERT